MSDDDEEEQKRKDRDLFLTWLWLEAMFGSKPKTDDSSSYTGSADASGCGKVLLVVIVIAAIAYFYNQSQTTSAPSYSPPASTSYSTPVPEPAPAPAPTPAPPPEPSGQAAVNYDQMHQQFADAMAAARRGECDNAWTIYTQAETEVRQSGVLDAPDAESRRQKTAVQEEEQNFATSEAQCRAAAQNSANPDASGQNQGGQKQDVINQWLNGGKQ